MALEPLVPWKGTQLKKSDRGREGACDLGIRADLMRLWWKYNLKSEEERVKPSRQHGVWGGRL